MIKKILKRLTFVSLSLLFICAFIFNNLPKQKAFSVGNVSCTQTELENYYNDIYAPWYVYYYNEQPLSLYEKLDSTSGAYMYYTNEQVINEVMRQLMFDVNYDMTPLLEGRYNIGYNMGFSDGEDSGYDIGYNMGFSDGEDSGYDIGYSVGENSGYDIGYNRGFSDGEVSGYDIGYSVGEENGIKKGKTIGYKEYEDEKGASFKLKDLLFGIIDAPFNIIKSALNFEIFGINLSSVILFLISTSLVFFVIRFFMKGN